MSLRAKRVLFSGKDDLFDKGSSQNKVLMYLADDNFLALVSI